MSTNDELKNETANGTKPVLTVVYHLSNSDKEKIVKIPKNAKNIIGNGIYLNYDLPIGKFGYMTHSEHLGYENADVVVLKNSENETTICFTTYEDYIRVSISIDAFHQGLNAMNKNSVNVWDYS
jgi:hypothetical protein